LKSEREKAGIGKASVRTVITNHNIILLILILLIIPGGCSARGLRPAQRAAGGSETVGALSYEENTNTSTNTNTKMTCHILTQAVAGRKLPKFNK